MKRTPEQQRDFELLNNSIERVINTTIRLLEQMKPAAEQDEDDHFMNLEDWKALKDTTVYIWNDARNEAFKRGTK